MDEQLHRQSSISNTASAVFDDLKETRSCRLRTKKVFLMLQSMKFFTDSAAAKTITQELLVANTMAPNAGNLWLDVEYIDDATGLSRHLTTRDIAGGALATSTADWSATVWGAITLLKKKLAGTTPTAVKQNTPITVTIWSTLASASANDIYFIDPDFGVN